MRVSLATGDLHHVQGFGLEYPSLLCMQKVDWFLELQYPIMMIATCREVRRLEETWKAAKLSLN